MTTVFIGGIDVHGVVEAELHAVLSAAGPVSGIRVPEGKGCAFATFCTRAAAEEALKICQGAQVGLYKIRLEWGKSNPPPSALRAGREDKILSMGTPRYLNEPSTFSVGLWKVCISRLREHPEGP